MNETSAPAFRPVVETGYRPGALGEPATGWRAVVLREDRLPSGTTVLTAEPADSEPTRRVVIAPSLRGLTGMMTELVLRLAQRHGWAVVAPEPFPEEAAGDEATRQALVGLRGDDRPLADLAAAADLLGAAPAALIGFCLGGMYALKSAASPRFDRIVSCYGMIVPPADWRGPAGTDPLDVVAGHGDKVLAVVGGRDAMTPPEDVAALGALGTTVLTFPEAGHAFVHDPSLPGYRPEDAAAAWSAAVRFLG